LFLASSRQEGSRTAVAYAALSRPYVRKAERDAVSEQSLLHELLATLHPGLLPDAAAPVQQQTSIQHTIHFDISDELDSVLYPTNRLIYSPHTIKPSLLQPFLDGTREVVLVCVQNGKTLQATLQALHSSYLIADTQHSVFRRKRGETV